MAPETKTKKISSLEDIEWPGLKIATLGNDYKSRDGVYLFWNRKEVNQELLGSDSIYDYYLRKSYKKKFSHEELMYVIKEYFSDSIQNKQFYFEENEFYPQGGFEDMNKKLYEILDDLSIEDIKFEIDYDPFMKESSVALGFSYLDRHKVWIDVSWCIEGEISIPVKERHDAFCDGFSTDLDVGMAVFSGLIIAILDLNP